MGNKGIKVWSLFKITLPVILFFHLLGCSKFIQNGNEQVISLSQILIGKEGSSEFLSRSMRNISSKIAIIKGRSVHLIKGIEITGDGNYTLNDLIAGLLIVLTGSFFLWLGRRLRIKRILVEMDLKDRMLVKKKEELEKALEKIINLESDLINATEIAKQADAMKNALVANMSHEIRTPMNAIVGLTSLLNDPALTRSEVEDYIKTINSSCIQLLKVIDDIVDISKMESEQLTITPEMVNLNDLLRDLYSAFISQSKSHGINFTYSAGLPDDRSQFRTDKSRITQVFRNLLNNAFKFTEMGNIEFGYFTDDEKITFYVKDDGIGISPKNQSLIFDRFWQAESSISRSYGGLGLGLSISKRIVEKMGGTIGVESESGKGSVFSFSFPFSKNWP